MVHKLEKGIPSVRSSLRDERADIFLEKMKSASSKSGKVLFDGKWVTRDEALEQYKRLRRKHCWIFSELVGLYVLILFGSLFAGLFLSVLCY